MKYKYAVEERTVSESRWHRISWHMTREGAERALKWQENNWPCSIIRRRIINL